LFPLRCCALAALVAAGLFGDASVGLAAAATIVDSGDSPANWTAIAAPGAGARIVEGKGRDGKAIGLDFDLGRGRSHAIARRTVSVDLPDNFMFVFTLRGDCDPNTLEIKFISGENVWWRRLADFAFPGSWAELRVSNPRIAFAWGPAGGGLPRHLDAIELAVVAGKGGSGRVWLDEIRIEPRDAEADARPPLVATSSNPAEAANLLDGAAGTVWRSAAGDAQPAVTLDFRHEVEQGGLQIEHAPAGFSSAYLVEASRDGVKWEELRRFTRSDGGVDPIFLPEVYARYLRLRFSPPAGAAVAIGEIRIEPFEFSATTNGFLSAIAHGAPLGLYPRYFSGEQSYWTVVGAAGGQQEALINEEGSVEIDAGSLTIEPFVYRNGTLRTWKDAERSVSLEDGDLPIPTVTRRDGDLVLSVTAFAAGKADSATLYVRYRLRLDTGAARVRLFAALRPFQVLPPWQALNRTGGAASISRIARDGATVRADGHRIVALEAPDAFGAAAFEEGDITSFLLRGAVPAAASTQDPFSRASAALAWDLDLSVSQPKEIWLAVPWSKASKVAPHGKSAADREALLAATRAQWRVLLDRAGIELPEAVRDWAESLRSNLAYALINRDGPAIQPGSRNYQRSWIRDGAMTSSALLELGYTDEVKQFLRWYARYIGKDGWVPCCVDARGADPVPEHDSFGEFIWAVAEVWRFTRDASFVRELWPQVRAAAACMGRLRATRLTPEYQAEAQRAFFGLLPQSISHEGYSARPVHSYWDQAFALRGFTDAALLASVVGERAEAARLAAERDAFERDLRDSIARTIAAHQLDVVPASVELADFDPSSTAVSFLLGSEGVYPRDALERSFDRYARGQKEGRGQRTPGVGYTAYELRNAPALMLLGRKREAIELIDSLVADQRPPDWNQWPEISWRVPTEPSFLGDLPHSWIGSTFVHALRSLLVLEHGDAAQSSKLLVGAGVPLAWLDGKGEVRARALPTWYGAMSLRIRRDASVAAPGGARVEVRLEAAPAAASSTRSAVRAFTVPDGGAITVVAPFGAEVDSATVDGVVERIDHGSVRVRGLPASVVFQYKPRLEKPW